MKTSVWSFAVVGLLSTCAGCNALATPPVPEEHARDFIRLDPKSPRLAYVKVEVVQESSVAPNVQLTGRVGFDEDHTQRVASPIDGRATKILVQLGDKVTNGQALVELTSAQVAALEADSAKSEQDLAVAEKALDRASKLRAEGAISDKESAQIEADFKKAKADTARTNAQLRSLSLSNTGPSVSASLRARIAGTIVERNILLGQEVRSDAPAPLLTISDLGTDWVQADVYEQDLGAVTKGAVVNVHVPAYPGESFSGTVSHVGDVLDPATHTVKIRCVVPNPGNRLKPEMFARIELTNAGDLKAILLPSRAILTDSQHARVIVATEDNVYRQRVVETGPEVDGNVRVLSGIRPGEKVVTDGAIFLRREMESD